MLAATTLFPELLDKIFSFLETGDLLSAAQVNPIWDSIAKLSLRRRLILQVENVNPSNEKYSLRFRNYESYGPAGLIYLPTAEEYQEPEEENEEFENFDLQNLKLDGCLDASFFRLETTRNLPFLAIEYAACSWCSRITRLEFGSTHWRFEYTLAVQDWNVAGTFVLSKFTCLKKLKVGLEWAQGYASKLQVSTLPDEQQEFQSIEKVHIDLSNFNFCTDLNLQFATRCPNLKKFRLNAFGFEPFCSIFSAKYEKLAGVGTFACSGDRSTPAVLDALAPVLNKLQLTSLTLDDSNISTLHILEASAAAKVETLLVIMYCNSTMIAANHINLVLATLSNRGYSALEDLQLRWMDSRDKKPEEFEGRINIEEFHLPSIRRLELAGIDLGFEDARGCLIYKRLLTALPNIELLAVRSDQPMNLLIPTYRRCPKRLIYPSRFLKYTSQLKHLRHLVWDWDFCKKNFIERRRLEKIPKYLARHQALESLTVTLAGSKSLPALEAVVEGCAAAPRMRRLGVHAGSDSTLQHCPKLEHLQSEFPAVCIRMDYDDYYWIINDYQIDDLDQLCRDLEPVAPSTVSEAQSSSVGSFCRTH